MFYLKIKLIYIKIKLSRYISLLRGEHHTNKPHPSNSRSIRDAHNRFPANNHMRHIRHVPSGKHKRGRRGDMHSRRLPTQQRSLVLLTARLQHPNRDQDRSASQSRDHRQPGQHQERARHS